MPDADLIDPGNLCDEVLQILQRKVVPGVQSQTCLACFFGSLLERLNGCFAVGG